MSQMRELVMRITSVQKSPKSELSSRGKRPFKVVVFSQLFWPQMVLPDTKKNCEKQGMSQMIDLVMRINSVQKSSKSELSSRGKRPFKVFSFSHFFGHRRYSKGNESFVSFVTFYLFLHSSAHWSARLFLRFGYQHSKTF